MKAERELRLLVPNTGPDNGYFSFRDFRSQVAFQAGDVVRAGLNGNDPRRAAFESPARKDPDVRARVDDHVAGANRSFVPQIGLIVIDFPNQPGQRFTAVRLGNPKISERGSVLLKGVSLDLLLVEQG